MLQLKNKELQKRLSINGFFTESFIDEITCKKLEHIYYNHFEHEKMLFYSTSFHTDFELKKKISDEVISLLKDKLDDYFIDYKILGSSFLLKIPNEQNALPLHQDWTVTDEQQFGSFTIWIPLQNTNKENGAIRVIPGSHLIEDNLRAPSIPVAYEDARKQLEQNMRTLPLKQGEAFIFNQKVMHASWPNCSNENRLALTIGLVPKDAELFMYYLDKTKKTIAQYKMPDDLFLHYPEIIEKPSIGTFHTSFLYTPQKISATYLIETLAENRKNNSNMQSLFSQPEHQQSFEKNGFIKLNALGKNEVEELKNYLYASGIKKETDYGFYVGMDHENKNLVAAMMKKIESVAMPKIAPFLKDYQLITASYVLKDTNAKGVVPPHQDWTFVEDESRHCSVTCWIALVDTNMENGCIGVIKGSHKYFNNVRPSPSPQVPSPLSKHMFSMFPYFELLPMKAGEALIFDNRTFHASPPNITNASRLAVGLSFTQKEAALCHYYLKPGTKDTLLKYKIDPSFFMKYDNGTLSKMYDKGDVIHDFELIEEIPYRWDDLSKKEMTNRVLNSGNIYNKALTQHMMQLFGEQMKSGFKNKIIESFTLINPLNWIRKIQNKMGI